MKTVEQYYQDIQPLIENEWYQAAICAYQQLLETDPTLAKAHYDLGTLQYKFGDKNRATEHYHKAVEHDPDNIDYLKSLADFYHAELERIEPALELYKKIIAKGHRDVDTFFIAANLSVAAHNLEDAATYYQKVLELEPWHSEAFEFLEKIKHHQKNERHTLSPEALYQKSQEAFAAGNVESALSILEQLVKGYPEYALAHNDLGVYHQKMGHNDQAGEHHKRAVRLEPYNNTFKKNLADFLYIVQGDVIEAIKIYLDVLKSDPEDIEVLLAAGHISRAVNQPQNAETFYRRVLEIEPWNLEAGEHLEQLRQDSGKKTAAGF